MPTPLPPAERRGYGLTDLSNATVAYFLVRADLEATADLLARLTDGEHRPLVIGESAADVPDDRQAFVVYQVRGQAHTLFAGSYANYETLPARLSANGGPDVLAFVNEDVSGWSDLSLHRNGEQIEQLAWGLDYFEEMEEAAGLLGEAGEPAPAPDAHPVPDGWDHAVLVRDPNEPDMADAYQFRSSVRTITDADLATGEAFVDATLRFHDTWLPDLDEMLWLEHPRNLLHSRLPAEAFVGACLVLPG